MLLIQREKDAWQSILCGDQKSGRGGGFEPQRDGYEKVLVPGGGVRLEGVLGFVALKWLCCSPCQHFQLEVLFLHVLPIGVKDKFPQ